MDTQLTRVTTIRIPGIRHLSLRFGNPIHSARIGRGQRVHYFEPDAVFGLLRWHGNEFGTTHCEFSILRAVPGRTIAITVPGVTPGAEILLAGSSVATVRRVLALVRDIKAQGIPASEVSPDYWRSVHQRLIAHVPPSEYRAATHAAYLERLRCAR
jgi:hypothetical protein